uniref:ATP synthase subunit a n=1 Tax=Cantacader sp. TaxID=2931283 RepID=A0A8T9ZXR2_9HEMI|nr:ATPase subunit 6 [Cantacader sp.]
MMNNLFSSFDPATSKNLSMNWIIMLMIMMLMSNLKWITPSRTMMMNMKLLNYLNNEFKTLLKSKNNEFILIIISIFYFIMLSNLLGLMPYIFTSTSHLITSMSMALPMWLSLMIFGWHKKTQFMFVHLVPNNTPNILMPFMVLIETISNLIRPISLSVRLTANMIAGHLLMTLLGNNNINQSYSFCVLILMTQIILMLFETAVSLIQAYVFTTLSTLYLSELT